MARRACQRGRHAAASHPPAHITHRSLLLVTNYTAPLADVLNPVTCPPHTGCVMSLRKLTPGGYEYVTGSIACGDRALEPGESLSDYYFAHGYPAGEWFGAGAAHLGLSGEVTAAQMNALFGEGRHPNADAIEADMIRAGATPKQAEQATRLGRRFAQYGSLDGLRSQVIAAYKQYNVDHGRPIGAPLDTATRATIRTNVQSQAFQKAHDGRAPAGSDELTSWLAEQKRQLKSAVAGFEAVFAPPKSVSVGWALADDVTRERFANLHRQAVKDTLRHLETNAAFTRHGNSGEAQVDIVGITAALFEHWDSRAGDPHLHTHATISAKVKRRTDGAWTALDGRTILAATVTMSEFYDSRLRDLFRDEGAVWVQRPAGGVDVKRPVWDLRGVPEELLVGFSKRAQQVEAERARQIVAFRAAHDREPSPKEILEIGKRAQYGTRAAKQAPKTLAQHVGRWRQFAENILDQATLDTLATSVFGGPAEPISTVEVSQLAAATRTVVSDKYSHWNRWNIEAEAHRQTAHLRLLSGQRNKLIQDIADAAIDSGDTVALQAPAIVAEPPQLRRRSGDSVFEEHNSRRYTTEQTLREEAALVAWAQQRDGHRLTAQTVEAAMGGLGLNSGQRRMITEFARSGLRVQLALAPAGAGKTTAMRILAQAWRSAGGRVYAFGPSARAAQELGAAIDAPPHTLHQVTTALAVGTADRTYAFRNGDLIIVDEAAMAGTHTLHDVVQYALLRGADVRLVGDDKQLGAVEAGGAIRLIAHDVGAVRFREVVRFHDPGQAAASLRIRAGDIAGLGYYLDQGWVDSGSRETMRDAAQRAWRHDLDAGRQTLLIVPTNEDVVWLNLQARAQRITRGDVHDSAAAALHDGTHASAGDWIVTRNNNRLLSVFGGRDFVKNGDTWQVTAVRRDHALEITHLRHQGTAVLPAAYVAAHVELAYATTVNRTQGMTSEGSAHTLVPQTMTREQFYPAVTRARQDNRMYVETVQHVIDDHRETPEERTVLSVLTGVLKHSGLETAATEQLRESLGTEESLATLVSRHDYAARLGADERFAVLLNRHVPEVRGHPAEPALIQTLRNAEDLGWQAEQLIPAALATGRLNGALDPAAVLQWRIEQKIEQQRPPISMAEPQLTPIDPPRAIVDRTCDTAGADTDGSSVQGVQHAKPALPWLARAHVDVGRDQPEIADYLQQLAEAIRTRTAELREQVTADKPAWLAGIGARPSPPNTPTAWDELAGLAAAFRETYNITNTDAAAPLGPQPTSAGAKARAWQDITTRWRQPVTVSDEDIRA
ncbi:MAG TPA: MobF family relaxase, partial [Pseudonocardiaceae bacterium]|nr:MobF family relaxase [Pseudonocardiaceae bacterium]